MTPTAAPLREASRSQPAGTAPGAASLKWGSDGAGWPHRQHSRFVETGSINWHVQIMGSGPVALLLHGTGASSHSWACLCERLADSMTLIVPDLPGHAFTRCEDLRCFSMSGMALALKRLVDALEVTPQFIVGHSAGAALAIRMSCAGQANSRRIVSINGALLPFAGLQGLLFAPLARWMAAGDAPARFFARRAAKPEALRRLIDSTGSTLSREGLAYYQLLAGSEVHVRGALRMMAHWDLEKLAPMLATCPAEVNLIHAQRDRLVPRRVAADANRRLPDSNLIELAGLGHLAHEEQPDRFADLILRLTAGDAGAADGTTS